MGFSLQTCSVMPPSNRGTLAAITAEFILCHAEIKVSKRKAHRADGTRQSVF